VSMRPPAPPRNLASGRRRAWRPLTRPMPVLAGLAAVLYRHEIPVVLRTGLAEARERIPPAVGALVEVPGGVRLVARAEDLAGAARMLAGLGWRFTVERPAELRDEVRALAARLAATRTPDRPRDGTGAGASGQPRDAPPAGVRPAARRSTALHFLGSTMERETGRLGWPGDVRTCHPAAGTRRPAPAPTTAARGR
jgi:hypothetical protein